MEAALGRFKYVPEPGAALRAADGRGHRRGQNCGRPIGCASVVENSAPLLCPRKGYSRMYGFMSCYLYFYAAVPVQRCRGQRKKGSGDA